MLCHFLLFIGVTVHLASCGPVNRREPEAEASPPAPKGDEDPAETDWQNLEYSRYLSEVVAVIESDPGLKAKFNNVSQDDIQSGRVVDMLDFHDGVRSKFDEIKRREIERLRNAMQKLIEAEQYDKIKIPEHLDHASVDSFTKDDLKKLIKKTTNDLEELDKKRRSEFKDYELKKEHNYKERLEKAKNEEERKRIAKEHEEAEKKHKEHEKLKHPGSKDQLEEVWEKADHLDKEAFDMRTMFALHDLNGDGYLEADELEALFQYELDKIYDKDAPEDDLKERIEEENRMREHVQKEMDKDRDGFISLKEWLAEENDPDFKEDKGWKTIDEQPIFTDEEFAEFERNWNREHPTPVQPVTVPVNQGAQQVQQQVPIQGQGVPQQPQGVPPQGQNVPPQGQGVPPQNQGQGVPPQGQGIPPQGQGVPPQGQGVPPQGQGVPPQGQGVPPQGQQNVPPQGQGAQGGLAQGY